MITGERRAAAWAAALTAGAVLLAGCGGTATPSAEPNVPPTSEGSPTPEETTQVEQSPTATPAPTDPATSPALAEFYQQEPSWKACTAGFQCAKVKVPLDYADPEGPTMRLALTRLKASGTGKRIGSLLVNPGGPGGSGLEYAQRARTTISPGVRARYDVVGFDPRGVGESDPIDCLDDKDLDTFLEADVTPDSDDEITALTDQAKALADGCEKESGKYLAHISTPDVARDLDVLRAVLGDKKLYYLGKSYGTYIGAVYADMFPARVGRLVLDGALDPALPSAELTLAQAAGFQLAFERYVEGCLKRAPCPLGKSKDEIVRKVTRLLERLDSHPLPTQSGRRLDESLGVLGIIVAMYDEESWEALNEYLLLAFSGDGTGLLYLSDFYTDRQEDGSYKNNANEVIYAVNCLDHPGDDSVEGIEKQLPALEKASPVFGVNIGWSNLPCAFWPVSSDAEPHELSAAGAGPILVVGTTRDPATPYAWAESLADQLDSGVLLTYAGDGHTAYRRGSVCIDTAVDAYLLKGDPPADGKRCG